jgi:hypothetical protein
MIGGVVALALTGCGGAEHPDPAAVLAEAQRATGVLHAPVASLGAEAGGYDASSVDARAPGVVAVLYGPPACESEGSCGDRLGVATTTHRWSRRQRHGCWRRLGRAWTVGCLGSHYAAILTGKVMAEIVSQPKEPAVGPLLSQLRLGRGRPGALPAPERLSCGEYRHWIPSLRATMPRELRPDCPA